MYIDIYRRNTNKHINAIVYKYTYIRFCIQLDCLIQSTQRFNPIRRLNSIRRFNSIRFNSSKKFNSIQIDSIQSGDSQSSARCVAAVLS